MSPEYTEMVAAIAFGVLSAIFVSAFVVLVIICRRQRLYYKSTYLDNQNEMSRPEVMLIEPEKAELELGEVQLNPNLEQILADEQWIDDATGLIPHCLSILKTCRFLTERLTALAMGTTQASGSGLSLIVESAKRISSRVDDMVRSMYPPLDPRLLEARAAALSLAVSHLALIAKYECGQRDKSFSWIDKSLAEMDGHMVVLREAAVTQEASGKIQSVINASYNTSV
ncbi:transmembrane protein 98 [Tribolium castaneum]|uniref:Transmembrane protein 98 n=1 Tax=Tribolium castaneum TaxID=7070 RepID=D6WNA3_TRICA|nr:PREDICTED: transmembrane protein 98 [Tribolium castaneum]EFA03806.1 Transmembrane protein 98-like Protein [Tribolium castaneum]|eukprot:XP_966893.1 PREDICTED: transmembrane protein 98 [Tribolium castaneum]